MPEMMDRAVDPDARPQLPHRALQQRRWIISMKSRRCRRARIPVVDDELYVKTHRGTFTTDSQVKRDNRLCEVLLMNAEKFSLLASQFGQPYPQEQSSEIVGESALRAGSRQH